jgi:hypothetical protein
MQALRRNMSGEESVAIVLHFRFYAYSGTLNSWQATEKKPLTSPPYAGTPLLYTATVSVPAFDSAFPILYLFSDFVYFLLYYVVGYRKGIVKQNLQRSLPHMSEIEIEALKKLSITISATFSWRLQNAYHCKETMLRHCSMTKEGKKIFDTLNDQKKSSILVMGHFGNWEWGGNTFSLPAGSRFMSFIIPSSPYFDGLIEDDATALSDEAHSDERNVQGNGGQQKPCFGDSLYCRPDSSPRKCLLDNFSEPGHSVFWVRNGLRGNSIILLFMYP